MNETRRIEISVERTIPAAPDEVFDGWLNPEVPGNPWNMAEKLLFSPKVDGFFYWTIRGIAHYGRFTELERPRQIQCTWVSPSTSGLESLVTVTFKKLGKNTLMTLVHSDLPDTDGGKGHEKGWNFFLDSFLKRFTQGLP